MFVHSVEFTDNYATFEAGRTNVNTTFASPVETMAHSNVARGAYVRSGNQQIYTYMYIYIYIYIHMYIYVYIYIVVVYKRMSFEEIQNIINK